MITAIGVADIYRFRKDPQIVGKNIRANLITAAICAAFAITSYALGGLVGLLIAFMNGGVAVVALIAVAIKRDELKFWSLEIDRHYLTQRSSSWTKRRTLDLNEVTKLLVLKNPADPHKSIYIIKAQRDESTEYRMRLNGLSKAINDQSKAFGGDVEDLARLIELIESRTGKTFG